LICLFVWFRLVGLPGWTISQIELASEFELVPHRFLDERLPILELIQDVRSNWLILARKVSQHFFKELLLLVRIPRQIVERNGGGVRSPQ
jgi:hypothetical protein